MSMKNAAKFWGIIALVAVIGFGVAGCKSPTDEPAHVHQWGKWDVTAATCIATGSRTRTCALDATHTETETIPIDLVNGHDWDFDNAEETDVPTCTKKGSGTANCKRNGCNETDTQPIAIDPNAHDYQTYTQTTAPTCSAVGKEEAPCTRDSNHEKGIRDIPINPTAHNLAVGAYLCSECNNPYELGDTGPGGGKIFYVSVEGFTMTDDNTTVHYLEAAPADMPRGLFYYPLWASSDYTSTNIAGTATAIGTGRKNTALILATDAGAPAAKACNEYSNGDKTDWFLPSKDELNELFVNRDYVGNLVGYSDSSVWYWSSSEYDSEHPWTQNFANDHNGGSQFSGFVKGNPFSVRAVRAF